MSDSELERVDQADRHSALDGLRKDSLKALVVYLSRDSSAAALDELVESTRWWPYQQPPR
jgi:Mg/Co/Ni transporter MgtE